MDELLNGTLADAIERLAEVASGRREKVAAGPTDMLTAVGSALRDNPMLSHALVGGGLGAGVGGVGAALGNRGRDPEAKRSVLGSMLTGGLAGAGAGAGVGAVRTGLAGLESGQGMAHGDALKPGQFTDPKTGKLMMVDPGALKSNPDLHKQIRSLTTPNLQTGVAAGVGAAYEKVRDQIPTTSSILPWVAGADLALHAPGVGMARTTPEQAGGYWGRKFLERGVAGATNLPENLKTLIAGNASPGMHGDTSLDVPGHKPVTPATTRAGRAWQGLKGSVTGRKPGEGVLDILGRQASPGTGDRDVVKSQTPVTRDVEKYTYDSDGKPKDKWTEKERVTDAAGKPKFKTEAANEGVVGGLKGVGAKETEYFKDRSMFRIPGTNKIYRGAAGPGSAALGRVMAYGAPMGVEYLARGMADDVQSQKTLRDLMQQYAKPVPGQGD